MYFITLKNLVRAQLFLNKTYFKLLENKMILSKKVKEEHASLYKMLGDDAEWDIELDRELSFLRQKFTKDFKIDLQRISNLDDFKRYRATLTDLERYFLK